MIKTGRQATKAVKAIKKKTRWSIREIARELGFSHNAINEIHKGHVDNPREDIRLAIGKLQQEWCGQ